MTCHVRSLYAIANPGNHYVVFIMPFLNLLIYSTQHVTKNLWPQGLVKQKASPHTIVFRIVTHLADQGDLSFVYDLSLYTKTNNRNRNESDQAILHSVEKMASNFLHFTHKGMCDCQLWGIKYGCKQIIHKSRDTNKIFNNLGWAKCHARYNKQLSQIFKVSLMVSSDKA